MRILNLQNTILVSLLVAGAAASAACSSSDAARPDAGAGTTSTTGGTSAGGTSSGGTGNVATGGTSTAGSVGIAGTTSAGGGGSALPSVCDGTASRVLMNMPDQAFIDDFEKVNNNTTTMLPDPTAASPAWYGFNDITPPNSVQILRTPGGAAGTAFSGHYAGTGAKTPVGGGYGVGVEVNVGVDKSLGQFCVDASAFQGVSFWAKAGTSTNAMISAGFVVPSQNQVMNNGDCPDATPAKCNNYPQKNITLSTEWEQYTVDFTEVTGSTGAKVVGAKLQQILWLAPTKDWDFSLDEVAFYQGTKPAGAVAPPASGSGGTGAGGSGAGGSGG